MPECVLNLKLSSVHDMKWRWLLFWQVYDMKYNYWCGKCITWSKGDLVMTWRELEVQRTLSWHVRNMKLLDDIVVTSTESDVMMTLTRKTQNLKMVLLWWGHGMKKWMTFTVMSTWHEVKMTLLWQVHKLK